ncbi:MAG: DUF6279 family lipoprotein [Thiohalomonadales bacterium]
MSRSTISTILVVILILSLAGCSGLKMVYSRLDWIVPYKIDDYVSLNEKQSKELDKELRIFLDWHCANAVNQYAQWLRNIRSDVANGTIDKEKISHYMLTMATFWQDVTEKIGHGADSVLFNIEPSQVDELFENLAEQNLEYQHDYLDLPYAELRLELLDTMQVRLEKWAGELTEQQIEAIRLWSYGATKRTAGWVGSRLVWQQALREVLTQKQPRKQFAQSLFELMHYPERLWTESYVWEREIGKREMIKLLFDIYQSLLPRQFEHLLQQLDSWSEDMDSLSCETKKKTTGQVATFQSK